MCACPLRRHGDKLLKFATTHLQPSATGRREHHAVERGICGGGGVASCCCCPYCSSCCCLISLCVEVDCALFQNFRLPILVALDGRSCCHVLRFGILSALLFFSCQTLLEYLQRHLAVASSSSHGSTRGGLDPRDPITRRCPALAKVCLFVYLLVCFILCLEFFFPHVCFIGPHPYIYTHAILGSSCRARSCGDLWPCAVPSVLHRPARLSLVFIPPNPYRCTWGLHSVGFLFSITCTLRCKTGSLIVILGIIIVFL